MHTNLEGDDGIRNTKRICVVMMMMMMMIIIIIIIIIRTGIQVSSNA
jgi:hypothetical protein